MNNKVYWKTEFIFLALVLTFLFIFIIDYYCSHFFNVDKIVLLFTFVIFVVQVRQYRHVVANVIHEVVMFSIDCINVN